MEKHGVKQWGQTRLILRHYYDAMLVRYERNRRSAPLGKGNQTRMALS